ncbi:hypothetical protein [Lysinibacillus sp. 3P01SB]|uniref:hypothetical protein n=1 Tax=Lysinibacillus sp. 3P01SB TaxID=3132284 RepID=UPI0039A542C0
MKKALKYLVPFLLMISIWGYNQGSASATTSESVLLGSNGFAQSKYINASSKVLVMLKNHGSVPITWIVVGPNNYAEMDTAQTLQPGAAKAVWVTTRSNTKHALNLYCAGDVNKCSATGNISLN